MKNLVKIAIVACGFIVATVATSSKSNAGQTAAAGEGCRGSGQCGTTPGGVKLNGSYTVWANK